MCRVLTRSLLDLARAAAAPQAALPPSWTLFLSQPKPPGVSLGAVPAPSPQDAPREGRTQPHCSPASCSLFPTDVPEGGLCVSLAYTEGFLWREGEWMLGGQTKNRKALMGRLPGGGDI